MKSVESSFRVCGAGISLSDLSLLVGKVFVRNLSIVRTSLICWDKSGGGLKCLKTM